MRYKPEDGIFENVEALEKGLTRTRIKVDANKYDTDRMILESQADDVEAVIDEYNAFIGEDF